MLKTEKRAAISLALVYACRMLGLFMILPVFSLYADELQSATPVLIGLAIGIYGLTQCIFQLPFGFLSDRFGRKQIIVIGLVIFCIGSVVAAQADSIYQVIAGRALQGMGAIAAAVMALAADLTREEMRLRIMAIIGMSIGVSFMLSMIIGPIVAAHYGLSPLFWLTAVLSLVAIAIVLLVTPTPHRQSFHRDTSLSLKDIGAVAANKELFKLDIGTFVLHLVLSATFVVFPLELKNRLLVEASAHWQTYLSVFTLSALFFIPMIIIAEKFNRSRQVFRLAIVLLIFAELGLAQGGNYLFTFVMLVAFFAAFNFLEAMLPSTVARIAPAAMKGTAMGLFSSAQFFGAFCGGLTGGLLLASGSNANTFYGLAAVLVIWLLVSLTMKPFKLLRSRIISLDGIDDQNLQQFYQQAGSIEGVEEISIYPDDRVAYLKISKNFNELQLEKLLGRKQTATQS